LSTGILRRQFFTFNERFKINPMPVQPYNGKMPELVAPEKVVFMHSGIAPGELEGLVG
jgi:hypothetical protein